MTMVMVRRRMTWIIIVNEKRKQTNKMENVQKNKRNLLSQSVQEQLGGRKPSTVFLGQLYLQDSDLLLTYFCSQKSGAE